MAADGTYTYVAGSSAGTDSFNYTVTDEFGATDIATLTMPQRQCGHAHQ